MNLRLIVLLSFSVLNSNLSCLFIFLIRNVPKSTFAVWSKYKDSQTLLTSPPLPLASDTHSLSISSDDEFTFYSDEEDDGYEAIAVDHYENLVSRLA